MALMKGCSSTVAKGCFAGVGCLLLLAIVGFLLLGRSCRDRRSGETSRPPAEAPAGAQ